MFPITVKFEPLKIRSALIRNGDGVRYADIVFKCRILLYGKKKSRQLRAEEMLMLLLWLFSVLVFSCYVQYLTNCDNLLQALVMFVCNEK